MADASVFNILPSSLRLGAVLARRSPGVTLYLADLQLGKHTTKVCLAWPSDQCCLFKGLKHVGWVIKLLRLLRVPLKSLNNSAEVLIDVS